MLTRGFQYLTMQLPEGHFSSHTSCGVSSENNLLNTFGAHQGPGVLAKEQTEEKPKTGSAPKKWMGSQALLWGSTWPCGPIEEM